MTCSNRVTGGVDCKSGTDRVERRLSGPLQVVTLTRPAHQELFITADGPDVGDLFQAMAADLRQQGARVVSLEVFGVAAAAGGPALRDAFGAPAFPVTWIEEGCDAPVPLVGVQAWAVTGLAVTPLEVAGRVVGTLFDDGCVRACRLGGLGGPAAAPAPEQAHAVFAQMTECLALAGMDFSHVVRTWFYNHRMLEWYGPFNKVRTAFFNEHGVFDGLVPASTGVGGRNALGGALTAGLLALIPLGDAVRAFAVPSPLQCPALEYGSAFSRAVELALPDHRRLLISGTASIAPEGHTVYVDDVEAQIKLTLDVVQAILESRAMGWDDVSRAIAYFKHAGDAPAFARCLAAAGIPQFPALCVKEDICRDDLLFEIELDALKAC